jgi:serine/threonine protein kinase
MLQGKYGELSDIWAAGVLLFILLTGKTPFNGQDDREILLKIQRKEIANFETMSDDAK